MLLLSLSDLKAFLEITSTEFDTLLTLILTHYSARFETFLNRSLEKIERTKYFDAGRRYYSLPAYPIESLAVTVNDAEQVVNTDYFIWEDTGIVEFTSPPTYIQPKQVKFVWTGGYSDVTEVPYDIQQAMMMQCAFLFRRRKDFGLSSVTMPDGSVGMNAPADLLPEVKRALKSLRRSPTV